MSAIYQRITACRACGSKHLQFVVQFGRPCISTFLAPGEKGRRAPLEVVCCGDCGLAQLRHTVDRDLLYRDTYWYRSGTNGSMVGALADVVEAAFKNAELRPGYRVLDIGANDGTLLSFYGPWLQRWAVEPAAVFHPELYRVLAAGDSQYYYAGFWPPAGHYFDGITFKVITSIACFYDADDPGAFIEAVKAHLDPEGIWIVQFQDADSVLAHNAFDYWCHEHLCCYSFMAFETLVKTHGMHIISYERVPVNGGSMRFIVGHSSWASRWTPQEDPGRPWRKFGTTIARLRATARILLAELRQEGKVVLGVGASTKANTLLQHYGITPTLMPAIVDLAPEKIGRVTVGSNIPIISEAEAEAMHPDYYVALPWHFLDGLRARAPAVPFIALLPEVTILPALDTERDDAHSPAQAVTS